MKNTENEMYLAEIYEHILEIQYATKEYGFSAMIFRVTGDYVSVFCEGFCYFEQNGKSVMDGEVA